MKRVNGLNRGVLEAEGGFKGFSSCLWFLSPVLTVTTVWNTEDTGDIYCTFIAVIHQAWIGADELASVGIWDPHFQCAHIQTQQDGLCKHAHCNVQLY